MYTLTFYSFKGGVGRTMALLNVAVELARTGRRVLVVDFDLEAPGLDSYDLPRPPDPGPGLVEHVLEYLRTDVAPKIDGYYYECPGVGANGGVLWVMPSGKQDDSYGLRLSTIDWQELYEKHDGYLLFENLKEEWRRSLKPDYVLIDSRTGHTDISGICTRQLPDAVCIFFHPDEQNRRGLETVVRLIRSEAEGPRKKDVQLYFVMSNVPDLDDEDEILATSMRRFREALGYKDLTATIHRYNSLALLNQVIFTLKRPKSRLAGEYRALVREIIRQNIEDREGALAFLGELLRRYPRADDEALLSISDKLNSIRNIHASDGEILRRLAHFHKGQHQLYEALELINKAENTGLRDPELFLTRAEVYQLLGNSNTAVEDALSAITTPGATSLQLAQAVEIILTHSPAALHKLPDYRILATLPPQPLNYIVTKMLRSRENLPIAEHLLKTGLRKALRDYEKTAFMNTLSLALIGQGKFAEAMSIISPSRLDRQRSLELGVFNYAHVFNYAIAEWGHTGIPPRDLFEYVVELATPTRDDPNFHQCLGIAYWAIGDPDEAFRYIELARRSLLEGLRLRFSAWRYLEVTAPDFLQDLEEQERMTRGDDTRPQVFALKSSETVQLIN